MGLLDFSFSTLSMSSIGINLTTTVLNCGFVLTREAKIEVPSIRRVDYSTTGFTYKTRILVDNLIDVPSSFLVFGLNTVFSSFTPPNSSDAPSLAYSASKGLTASAVQDDLEPTLPDSVFEQNAAQPWFGDGVQCGMHVYDFVNAEERKRVKGAYDRC